MPIIKVMMDGVAGVADFPCRQILGNRYCRLAPVFPPDKSIPLDAVNRIPDLLDFAGTVDLTETLTWLKATW